MVKKALILGWVLLMISACKQEFAEGSFGKDVELLQKLNDVHVLQHGDAMIAVSGAFQGRIFTSSANGMQGTSYGYFNRALVQSGDATTSFTRLGGESRMIFGPEVGKYAIFFAPNTPQNNKTIAVSPELNYKQFKVLSQTERSIRSGGKLNIRNAHATEFQLDVERTINLKTNQEIKAELGVSLTPSVTCVGFSAATTITNAGPRAWNKETGLLSIWDIACVIPTPNTCVIIPLSQYADTITNYFTPIDNNRLQLKDNVVYYRADAAYMNKLGVQPSLCKDVFGSYSPEINLLTIVKYTLTKEGTYVNSVWGHEKPYEGDVINVFNGEVNAALDRNWNFYELETSSAVKELEVGETQRHKQAVYHFEGDFESLDAIAIKTLGVSLRNRVKF